MPTSDPRPPAGAMRRQAPAAGRGLVRCACARPERRLAGGARFYFLRLSAARAHSRRHALHDILYGNLPVMEPVLAVIANAPAGHREMTHVWRITHG